MLTQELSIEETVIDINAQLFFCLPVSRTSAYTEWSEWSCGPWQSTSRGWTRRISPNFGWEWRFERTTTKERGRYKVQVCWDCDIVSEWQTQTKTRTQTGFVAEIQSEEPDYTPTFPTSVGLPGCQPTDGTVSTGDWTPEPDC